MTAKILVPSIGKPASATNNKNPRRRILVVDDEPLILHLIALTLTESGYHVDAAEDGAVAWQALQANGYDLLVTDNNMPNVSGMELLEKLHASRLTLPVIMVSGTMPTEELEQHPWLQIQATLLKPYTLAELFNTVKEVLVATRDAREQNTLPLNWQRLSSVDHLRA